MQVQVSLTIEIEASAGITEGERHLFAKGLDREQPGCEDRPKIARKKENEALDQGFP